MQVLHLLDQVSLAVVHYVYFVFRRIVYYQKSCSGAPGLVMHVGWTGGASAAAAGPGGGWMLCTC
jgi:hypothetical protein